MTALQVLVCVRVSPAAGMKFEFLECSMDTSIEEIKRQIEALGQESGEYHLPAAKQELWFMNEECKDNKRLRDYGICEEWIKQVGGRL